jgi:hypothetical protein
MIVALLTISRISLAKEDASTASQSRDLSQEVLQLQQSNKVYEQVIKNLIQRIEQLEKSIQGPTQDTIQDTIQEEDQSDTTINPEVQERLERESEENARLIQDAFDQRLIKEGGLLLGKYQYTYEPSLSYAYSSYDKIVIDGFTIFPVLIVGDIVSEKVKRETIINNHSFRFGLGNDMQMDIAIPIGYEEEVSFREDGFEETRRGDGLGDISLGLSYQLVKSHSDWPDTIAAFNWKTTTGKDPYRLVLNDETSLGSGFDTYGFSLTSIANSDPIVLFGGYSVNYTESDSKSIGKVQPGISNGFTLGMALALNFDTSLSFNFQFLHTDETEINEQKIKGTDLITSTFGVGLTIAKGDSYAIDIDLGIGLTEDSPDFQFTVSTPFNFTY